MRKILRTLLFCVTLFVAQAIDCFSGGELPSFFFKASPVDMKNVRWTAIDVD